MAALGKRRIIYKVLSEPERLNGQWKRKVELVCGHVVYQKLGDGPNSSKKKHKFAMCSECMAKEI